MRQVGAVHCRRAGGLLGLMVRRLAVFLLSTWALVSAAAAVSPLRAHLRGGGDKWLIGAPF